MPEEAWSVHLRYRGPADISAFYGEMTVDESVPKSFFAYGLRVCYLGIQERLQGEERLVRFSAWDSTRHDDPDAVPEDRCGEVLYASKKTTVKRFGGEGTGLQCMFPYDWEVGKTYRFLVETAMDGNRTSYTAYFFIAEIGRWKRLATFRVPSGGSLGCYSFIEDFRRDGKSYHERRSARFGNLWAEVSGIKKQLVSAKFTAAGTNSGNIDAGVKGNEFYLATGGETVQSTPVDAIIHRPIPRKQMLAW